MAERIRALLYPARQRLLGAVAALALLGCGTAFGDDGMAVVNINTADAQTIAANLKGIGLSRAEAIVSYRQTHGDFKDAYELTAIRGVGERTVALNEAQIRLRD